jgi:hypothetical protein
VTRELRVGSLVDYYSVAEGWLYGEAPKGRAEVCATGVLGEVAVVWLENVAGCRSVDSVQVVERNY